MYLSIVNHSVSYFMFDHNHFKSDIIHFIDLDWIAQTSIKFKSQLNLKCKLILCTIQV